MQTKKEQKYDRQLRLWKEHGQQRLEATHVLLINASATGTELLKNLVLPSIKAFTIVDPRVVSAEDADLDNNFFVPADTVGKARAQVATDLLQELNDDVKGYAVDMAFSDVLQREPDYLAKFQLVIATQMSLEDLVLDRVSQYCAQHQIPLVISRSYGLTGYVRLQLPEHPVIETHPENPIDLRLDQPWPELVEHCNKTSFIGDSLFVSHIPYVVILIKALQEWESQVPYSLCHYSISLN